MDPLTSIFFAGLAVGFASIGSGVGQGTALDIVLMIGAIFFIGLIAFFSLYSYKEYKDNKDKEKILPYDEDANQNSKNLIKSTECRESQEPESKFEEEGSFEDSTDSEDTCFMGNVNDPFPDLDRKLAHIVGQVDHLTFQARFCETDSIVTCYLRPELYSNLTRPLVGGLVRLEYSSGFGPRVHYIIQVIDSKIKEGSPWAWNTVLAEIIGEDEEMDDRIFYASLEPEQVVPCKVFDYLRDAFIRDADIVLLEVNETNRSYYIVEILIPYDSLGIPLTKSFKF